MSGSNQPEIIFHHYAASPFAEKVRIYFGMKGLKWRSYEVPMTNENRITPELTGGYRKIPVLQVGNDFYCDTELILREIDRRFPIPSKLVSAERDLSTMAGSFFDKTVFEAIVPFVMKPAKGNKKNFLTEQMKLHGISMAEFAQDRMTTFGMPVKVQGKTKKTLKNQLNSHLTLLESLLADNRSFLIKGNPPSLLDASAYAQIWFLLNSGSSHMLDPFPNILKWASRMKELGHGESQSISTESVISAVMEGNGNKTENHVFDDQSTHTKQGSKVTVRPADSGNFEIKGVLLGSTSHEVILETVHEKFGTIRVHFPQNGYYHFVSKL